MFDFRGFNFEKALARLYIYTGLFLREGGRKHLLDTVPPKHPNIYADHVTMCFKPSNAQVMMFEGFEDDGLEPIVMVTGEVCDERAQAVIVSVDYELLKNKIEISNKIFHITISTADGVSPAYSNEMLEKMAGTYKPVSVALITEPGVVAHTDRNHLPKEMWKRRGL